MWLRTDPTDNCGLIVMVTAIAVMLLLPPPSNYHLLVEVSV